MTLLTDIEQILRGRGLVGDDWATEMDAMGKRVQMYRRYYEGDHEVYLSEQMKAMLRTQVGFSDNQCGLIVDTMTDRLMVRAFQSDDAGANEWAADVMRRNRFDAMQIDVHESVLVDGDAYALVEYDEQTQRVVIAAEEAWDNYTGMMVVYDGRGREIVAAVKVWEAVDQTRVNVYFADEVQRYVARGEPDEAVGGLGSVDDAFGARVPLRTGRVPVIHWKNRRNRRKRYGVNYNAADTNVGLYGFGQSELAPVIPLQDALNRTIASMVMTGELSAFQVRVAKGFTPEDNFQPGSWVVITPEAGSADEYARVVSAVDAFAIETSPMAPFIEQANYLLSEMGSITHTPLPGLLGADTASGESLKERKEGLYGKLQRAQTRLGNSWEDLLSLAARVHNAYAVGERIAEDAAWQSQWQDVRPRDAQQTRENAKQMLEAGYEDEFLRIMGRMLNYDTDKIEQLKREKREAEAAAMRALGGNLPGFDRFNAGILN